MKFPIKLEYLIIEKSDNFDPDEPGTYYRLRAKLEGGSAVAGITRIPLWPEDSLPSLIKETEAEKVGELIAHVITKAFPD